MVCWVFALAGILVHCFVVWRWCRKIVVQENLTGGQTSPKMCPSVSNAIYLWRKLTVQFVGSFAQFIAHLLLLINANYASNHPLQCFEGHSSTPGILHPLRWRWQAASQHLFRSGFLTLVENRSVYFPPRERLSRGNQGSLQAQGLPSCSLPHINAPCPDFVWKIADI